MGMVIKAFFFLFFFFKIQVTRHVRFRPRQGEGGRGNKHTGWTVTPQEERVMGTLTACAIEAAAAPTVDVPSERIWRRGKKGKCEEKKFRVIIN